MGQVLRYDDLIWRITEAAGERQSLLDETGVSLPALVGGRAAAVGQANFLAFLYTTAEGDDPENPLISPPYARIELCPDGAVAAWDAFPQRAPRAGDVRFGVAAADMEPEEREAFIRTYYEVLTLEAGPLWRPWREVDGRDVQDLRHLFYAMVEPAFFPLYQAYAGDFIELIGGPS